MKDYIEAKRYNILKEFYGRKEDLLEVIHGKGLFNQRCHQNAVQMAYDDKSNDTGVVMCMCFSKTCNCYFLHFINYHNDTYIDNTLGWCSKRYDYYRLRKLTEPEYDGIIILFVKWKDWIKNNVIPWYLRLGFTV